MQMFESPPPVTTKKYKLLEIIELLGSNRDCIKPRLDRTETGSNRDWIKTRLDQKRDQN